MTMLRKTVAIIILLSRWQIWTNEKFCVVIVYFIIYKQIYSFKDHLCICLFSVNYSNLKKPCYSMIKLPCQQPLMTFVALVMHVTSQENTKKVTKVHLEWSFIEIYVCRIMSFWKSRQTLSLVSQRVQKHKLWY